MNIVDCKTLHNLLLRDEPPHLSLRGIPRISSTQTPSPPIQSGAGIKMEGSQGTTRLTTTITGGYSINIKNLGKHLLKTLLVIFLLIQTYSCANKSIENQVKVDKSKKAEPQSEKYEAYYHFTLSRLNFLRVTLKRQFERLKQPRNMTQIQP